MRQVLLEPLVLSLQIDEGSFARLDGLRRRHFPPSRNFVPAHVTLFHALPGSERAAISENLMHVSAATRPFAIEAIGVRFLGKGVAYALASPELTRFREQLAQSWAAWLTPQDRQAWQPHVTVQNRVPPENARALYNELTLNFAPFRIGAEGLLLWRYDSGPWHLLQAFTFGGNIPG